VQGGEVVHAVLQVAHVAEEVLAHLRGGTDGAGWGEGWAVDGVGVRRQGFCGWGWVADEEGGHHDEEEDRGDWEDGEEVGVQADEGVDG